MLIITGPNSGGKTASCKIAMQIQLLGQNGCYIPTTQGTTSIGRTYILPSNCPVQLISAIGRFGHELKRMREILFNAAARSFVFLDELSEGTTFEEKIAISGYILKWFHKLGASTSYS